MHNPRYLRDHLGMDRPPEIGDHLTYGKAILSIVGADGQVSGRELVYFLDHIQNLGFPEDVIEELKAFDFRNARLEDYVSNIKQGGTAMMLLYDAISASYQDGYSEKEREYTAVAANVLGVDPTVRVALENLVAIDQAVQRGRETENFPMVEDAVRTARMALIAPQPREFRVEEVAQVRRAAGARTGMATRARVPADVSRALRGFAGEMARLEEALESGKSKPEKAQAAVTKACDGALDVLRNAVAAHPGDEGVIGAFALRETFPWLMVSTLCERSYTKPRGFAGDYECLELIYANEPGGDGPLGPLVDTWALNLPSMRALRGMREQLGDLIQEELRTWQDPEALPIAVLGSGPAMEVFDLFKGGERPHAHITCIDVDPEANSHATRKAYQAGALGTVFMQQDNILEMASGQGRTVLPDQQLICAGGFFDYLADQQAQVLLNWIYGQLLPGGRLVLTQATPDAPDRVWLEHLVEWGLNPRSAEALGSLIGQSKFGPLEVDIQPDSTGALLVAVCRRSAK